MLKTVIGGRQLGRDRCHRALCLQVIVRRVALLLLYSLSVFVANPLRVEAQESASVTGWVVDAENGEPVSDILVRLQPPSHQSVTDPDGRFHFSDITRGTYVLSVDDPAFGSHTDILEVPESGEVQLSVRLGPTVFELEPLVVNVISREENLRRALGSPFYQITRADLETLSGGGLSLGDILSRRVPGMTIDLGASFGVPVCVEFRRPTSFVPGCQPPLVIVDGLRISGPNQFLDSTPPEHIESLTVLSSSQASTLYGLGALNGAIQVEMRRAPTAAIRGVNRQGPQDGLAEELSEWRTGYDWKLEAGGHPWFRSWGGATVGMIGGLAVALTASGDCSLLNDLRQQACAQHGNLANIATFTLPVLGGAFGAHLGGTTEQSQGKMLITTLAAIMPMFSGFFFASPNANGVDFKDQQIFGRILVVAGIPIAAAAADRVFRTQR